MANPTLREKGLIFDKIINGNLGVSYGEFHKKAKNTIHAGTDEKKFLKNIHYRYWKTKQETDGKNESHKRRFKSPNLVIIKEIELAGISADKKAGIIQGVEILNESKKAHLEVIERVNPNVLEVRER